MDDRLPVGCNSVKIVIPRTPVEKGKTDRRTEPRLGVGASKDTWLLTRQTIGRGDVAKRHADIEVLVGPPT